MTTCHVYLSFKLPYSIRILDLYQVISSYYINQAVIFDILPHWL